MSFRSAFPALLAAVLISPPAWASWAYVPQEVRIAEADLVVMGKVAKLGEEVAKDGTQYQTGVIEPLKVLRGKAPDVIRLAWPKVVPGAPRLSTTLPAPKVGEQSIWVMQADQKLPVYWATYPTDRQPTSALEEMQQRVKAVEQLKWSQPRDGLQLAVFVEARDVRKQQVRVNGEVVDALAQASAYVLWRNVADHPIRLLDYPYNNPYSIEFKDPRGRPIDVKTGIDAPRKPPLQARNFVAIEPGEVKSVGYGFQLGTFTAPGTHTLTLRYENDEAGALFGLEHVWTGTIATPPTAFDVEGRED